MHNFTCDVYVICGLCSDSHCTAVCKARLANILGKFPLDRNSAPETPHLCLLLWWNLQMAVRECKEVTCCSLEMSVWSLECISMILNTSVIILQKIHCVSITKINIIMIFRETFVIYFEKILNCLFIFYAHIPIFLYIQGVPGGMYQTSGECSLC